MNAWCAWIAYDGDDHALDELVRVALDEHVVLERGRLALVAVHREVAREDVLRQERPLLPGAEAGAAACRAGPTSCTSSTISSGVIAERASSAVVRAVARARRRCVHESSGRSRRNLVTIARLAAPSAVGAPHRRARRSCAPRRVRRACTRRSIVVGGVAGERAVELVVHLQHRREVARGDALDLFDGARRRRRRSAARGARAARGRRSPGSSRWCTPTRCSFPTGSRLNIV